MKWIFRICCGALLVCLFPACSNDKEEELIGNTNGDNCKEEVSFFNTVKPLIIDNCATSGCHEANGDEIELTGYDQVEKYKEDIDKEIKSGDMPPDDSDYVLTEEEKNAIYCWIKQGGIKN